MPSPFFWWEDVMNLDEVGVIHEAYRRMATPCVAFCSRPMREALTKELASDNEYSPVGLLVTAMNEANKDPRFSMEIPATNWAVAASGMCRVALADEEPLGNPHKPLALLASLYQGHHHPVNTVVIGKVSYRAITENSGEFISTTPYPCEFLGILIVKLATLWGADPDTVELEHPTCQDFDSKECLFNISWKLTPVWQSAR
jgi:hypothetical protein